MTISAKSIFVIVSCLAVMPPPTLNVFGTEADGANLRFKTANVAANVLPAARLHKTYCSALARGHTSHSIREKILTGTELERLPHHPDPQ
jgi:hypothetical protein